MEAHREGIASRATRKGMSLLSALLILVLVIAGAVALRTYVFQMYYISSGSMSSTLEVDDKVVGWKLFKDIDRGDVVVFEDPSGWLEGYDEDDNKIVKRVIGLPGDTVECCSSDGNLVVNGTELTETYLDNTVTPSEEPFTVTVDEDQLWVMGDNRSNSSDSRSHRELNNGQVPVKSVVGTVSVSMWPNPNWLEDGGPVFDRVPDTQDSN